MSGHHSRPCVWGGVLGGEEAEASSAVSARGRQMFRGPRQPVLGAVRSLVMVLGIGACNHLTLLVYCLRAVPGPCRPRLCTKHPAHG